MSTPSAFASGMLILDPASRAHPRTAYGVGTGFRCKGYQMKPRRTARAAASRRFSAPSLPMMLATWNSTVRVPM